MLSRLKQSQVRLRFAQIMVVVVFLVAGGVISVITPLLRGRDELAHFRFIRFIAQHSRLPITWEEREEADYKAEWPPLFHIVVGIAGSGIDLDSAPFIDTRLTGSNPRAQLVFGPDEVKFARVVATEDPYQGEVLLWYLGRWIALLSGAVGVVAAYLLIRAFYPDQPWLTLSATTFLAFIPGYINNSGVISYDPPLGVPLAFYLLLLFHTIRNPAQNWYYFGLGLFMGIAGLTKYTPLSATPIVPLCIVWLAYRKQWSWQATFWRIILFGLGLFLTFGSWLLYMIIYFNRVVELGWFNGIVYPFLANNLAVGDETSIWFANILTGGQLGGTQELRGNASLLQWAWAVLAGTWGQVWLVWVFLALLSFALIGVGYKWRRLDWQGRLWTVLLITHIGLLLFFPILRFLITGRVNTNTVASQHIIYPVGGAMVLFLIQGLRVWLTPFRLSGLFLGIAAISFWLNMAVVVRSYTPPLPIQAVPLSDDESPIAIFNEKITLVDYDYVVEKQVLKTTLYWRAESLLEKDYLIELTLVDINDQPQAKWVGHPLSGRYPTRAWMPGDRVRDIITTPIVGLSSGDYQVQVRLLEEADGFSSIEVQEQTSRPVTIKDNSLNLGQIKLPQFPVSTVNTVRLDGREVGYTLWQQGVAATGIPVYGERSSIVISTHTQLNGMRLSLIAPDGQRYDAIDHTGHTFSFIAEPYFASGEYRLRFEQWVDTNVVDWVETGTLLRIQTSQRQFEIGSVAHPVDANLAGQLALLGYDLPQNRVEAGSNLPVTLYWQALTTMGADFIAFNHLIDENQDVWGGKDRRIRGVYSTLLWAPGEIVTDPYEISVDTDAPDGIYHLLVGLYLPVGQAAVSLPIVQEGQLSDATSISIGPIKVGHAPPEFTLNAANPRTELNQPFGDPPMLTLLGYDLTDEANHSISDFQSPPSANLQSLKLTLYWRSEAVLPLDYTTFVHVRNETGEMVTQKDQLPLDGAYPTSLWDPGEIIADEIVVTLPAELPSGDYRIVIGLYDFQTGQRLTVPDNSDNEVRLTGVRVP